MMEQKEKEKKKLTATHLSLDEHEKLVKKAEAESRSVANYLRLLILKDIENAS